MKKITWSVRALKRVRTTGWKENAPEQKTKI